MTLQINRLANCWSADEAHTVITFLDELRDLLWETCGEQIIEMRRQDDINADQPELPFEDSVDF